MNDACTRNSMTRAGSALTAKSAPASKDGRAHCTGMTCTLTARRAVAARGWNKTVGARPAGDKVQVISVKTILPMAWPAGTTAVVAMASGLVVAPLVAGVVTWRFCRGRFSGGGAVGVSVLSARLRVFLGSGVARPPDGVLAGGFPLLPRLEIRTGSGGFGAWRVLLVVREAGIVSG